MTNDRDDWDMGFQELSDKIQEDEKAMWVTEAVIIGRLSVLATLETALRGHPDSLAQALIHLRQVIDNEIMSGVIDSNNWPADIDFGFDT